ncbi:MAG: hypothetical protein AVO33_08855 [delta proteobacterium ML8_F1]|nr:MAG: hypothetical protein AVO33_08855 [delta proteobacterium ML8_F1]
MKIRQDYVTNSSSTSFGAATATGLATAILTAVGISAAASADEAGADLAPDPAGQDGPDRDFNPDEWIKSDADYHEKLGKLDREISEYEKEWEATKDTLEGEDYEKTKAQYEEYIHHLKSKKEEAEVIEFERELEKIAQEAEMEYKQNWLDERKKDLENAREQIEMIEATIRGYGSAGYGIDEAKRQLEMYRDREKDLQKTLKKEGVVHDYKAAPREDIGPSKSVGELIEKVDDEYEAFIQQLKKEKNDRRKKEILRERMEARQEESEGYMECADHMDRNLKRAEIIQTGADIGVDVLEKVTGPAGKTIKKVYVGGKALATGGTEAYLDPENAGSHMAKATVKAAGDVAKEFTDTQIVKDGITLVSEVTQGGIDSYQKGEDLSKGMAKGTFKAGVDIVVDRAVGKYLPDSSLPNLDFGSHTGKNIVKSLVNKDPIIRTIIKDGIKDSLKNNTSNQLKNIPKGDGFIFGDWKAY